MFKSAINHIRISRCRQHLPTYISMYKRSVHYKWCKWKPWWWWLTFRSLSFRQMEKIEWREFLQNWKYVAHIWLFTQTDRRNGKIGLGSTTKSVIIYAMHSYTELTIYVTTEHTQSVLELCKIRFRKMYKKSFHCGENQSKRFYLKIAHVRKLKMKIDCANTNIWFKWQLPLWH